MLGSGASSSACTSPSNAMWPRDVPRSGFCADALRSVLDAPSALPNSGFASRLANSRASPSNAMWPRAVPRGGFCADALRSVLDAPSASSNSGFAPRPTRSSKSASNPSPATRERPRAASLRAAMSRSPPGDQSWPTGGPRPTLCSVSKSIRPLLPCMSKSSRLTFANSCSTCRCFLFCTYIADDAMVPTITHMKRQQIASAIAMSSASSPALLSFTLPSLSSADTFSGIDTFVVGDIDGAAVGAEGGETIWSVTLWTLTYVRPTARSRRRVNAPPNWA